MKTLVRLLTLSVFFLLSFGSVKAQVHPVLANVYLIPPYGSYLSDYYTSSREKLVVTLLNRDQQEPVLEAYLHMTVTSSTGLRIQNRPEINYPSITLDAGIPVRLSQEDLAPYFLSQNIVQQGYLNQGKLPNGMIEFTFQAVEKYTGKILSAPSTGRIWLTTQKPPLLIFPNRDENIPFGEPFNLKFQWQAQHNNISQVEYEFELRELPNSGAAPQLAFLYAPIIHQERLFYTSLIYSAIFPPLDAGKTYGWRVRAIAKDGVDELNIFENNGYSEIFWFHTNSGCEPPAVSANVHDYQLDLTWNAIENISEYEVQFCNKYEGTGEWRKYLTDRINYTFYSLQLGSTYQYRVGAKCANGNFVYGNVYELTMPEVDTARMANCGIIEDTDLSNREPLPELKAGDVFMASDYPVTVTKVTGSNGVFTGEGWVMLRWILNVRVAVEFENIPINTDKRATGGIINFKYNKDWKNVGNLDNYSDGGRQNTANGIIRPDYTFNFVIPENPVFVYDTTGYLIVYDYSTQPPTEAGRQKLNDDGTPVFPMTVKDKNGNVYRLTEETDENGNKIISSEYLGKQGTPLTADNFDADRIDSDKAIVSFEKGGGKYAFDKFDVKFSGSVRIRDKYTKIGDYNVPWKFLPEGGTDKIQAKIITVDNSVNPAEVMFQTPQGMLYEKKHIEGNTFEISAVAGVDNDVQQIYALYPTDDGKFLNLGRIDVVTYKPQTQKLVAVSVNDKTVNTSELKAKLNEIYGEVGVTFEIETDTFTYNNAISFFEEGSGWFSRYTAAMKAFNISYRERIGTSYDKDKNYLFILGGDASRSDRDAQGFMPLGGRFGYLFVEKIATDQINSIAAHELGHGIWALKHTFDNDYGNITVNTTDNLMDYTPLANHLAKWQWEIIRYPALFTDPFGGDEEGEYTKSDADLMIEIIQKIRCAYASNVTSIFITVPTANGISRKIKLHEIEVNVIPQIYLDQNGVEKVGSYYGIFHLYNNYKKETKIDNKVYFEFGAGLTVVLPNAESATVFETFINNFDFSAEINNIEKLVNERKPILSVIYNASYCVLKELSVNATYAIINELADKTFLTEDYENIIINIIRAAKSESYSLENKKIILSKFLSADVFNKFMKDINNFNGLDNADNFVFELADLCQQVYADDYVELDRLFINTQHAIHEYSISNVPIYFWNIVSGRVEREKNIYKFKTDVNKKDNYMIYPRGEYEAYSGRYKVLAGRMVYVYISYNDLDFVKKGTVLRIPAFELAYLLDMELTKLKLSVANKIFSAITIYSGVANFASSSLIGKFLLSYNIASSIFSLFDEDLIKYIQETCGEEGSIFNSFLSMAENILDIYSVGTGVRYVVEDTNIIKGFLESWSPVYNKLVKLNEARAVEINNAINELKSKLAGDYVIY